ncbi:MAG: tol-pal system protein YbgF [Proteobacteria bacterium]|nr:tol-pal system protein YbgF [Pseudomonadota bacterium]
MNRTRLLLGSSILCVVALLAGAPVGAVAVDPAMPNYVSAPPSGEIRVAGLFGESDEEKAARLQHEQNQDAAINRLNDRVRDLEDTVRNLTGQNEELSHRVSELNAKIDRQQKDFEYRICMMAAQQLGASAGSGDPNAVPCGASAGGAPMPGASAPPPTAGSVTLAPPPGVLGTLPANSANTSPAAPAAPDTRAQYDAAGTLLAKGRYDEAAAAFRNFADTNPKDDLAPNALYWVADIAYVQKDYDSAARGFAEVIKKYPVSTRAPESLLMMGQALLANGQKKEGCTALAALPAKFPKADAKVLSRGVDLRKASCRNT